ncbi:MAG TPA: DotU family type IV/VI secretion system protein [Myxococcales bacterium]|nr:DotU family type IV/VI secretion system protein [Myxococcales bacterium]
MDRLNEVVKDCLDAVVQLRAADPAALPPPAQLHARLKGYAEQMLRQAADEGFSSTEAQDVAFPVVALIDEVALTKGEAVRQHWQHSPLQMHFFQESVAGETFFEKLKELRSDAKRNEVLRAYYLCLALGFQGKYRVRGGELELATLTDSLAKELGRDRKHDPDTLSPSGERPSDSLVSGRQVGPLLILSAAAVALSLLIYAGLWFTLKVSVNSSAAEVSAAGLSSKAPAPREAP